MKHENGTGSVGEPDGGAFQPLIGGGFGHLELEVFECLWLDVCPVKYSFTGPGPAQACPGPGVEQG
jgi:hypothetical protein